MLVPMTPSALAGQLSHLKSIGLIKKVTHTCRHCHVFLGRSAIAAVCAGTPFIVIPAMAKKK